MGDNLIKINAKIQAYTKGIFPTFPQPTQYDVGKILGVDEQGQYSLLEPALTPQQAQQIIDKLNTIETGAQENKIEIVSVHGKVLQISRKQVDIPVAEDQSCGVVKSSNVENSVTVHSDGTMEVNEINISKITQRSDQDIILECNKERLNNG